MKILSCALLVVLLGSLGAGAEAGVPPATPAASPGPNSTAPPPVEDPAITAQARAQFIAWQSGKIDRSLYNAEANKQLTDALIADVAGKLSPLGPPTKVNFVDKSTADGNTIYTYAVDTAKGRVQMLLALDGSHKISGIFFRPAP